MRVSSPVLPNPQDQRLCNTFSPIAGSKVDWLATVREAADQAVGCSDALELPKRQRLNQRIFGIEKGKRCNIVTMQVEHRLLAQVSRHRDFV